MIMAMITVDYSIKNNEKFNMSSLMKKKWFKYYTTLWAIITNIAITSNTFDSVVHIIVLFI